MEIDETVKRLNAVSQSAGAYEYKNEKKILVTWSTFTVLIVPYEAKTMFDYHFVNPHIELPADVKAQISGIIGKFLRTPVKERFPEKKYCLRWIDDDAGKSFLGLYRKTTGHSDPFWFLFGEPNLDAIFTESELNQLKKDNPDLAPAIDAMKEIVEDKDNE